MGRNANAAERQGFRMISIPSWPSSFVDLLRPPMEAGRRTDEIGPRLQGGAVGELGVFEVLDAGEMLVDECSVGQGPEMFGGLQFGRVRGQKEQVDVLGDPEVDAGMPARPIEHQHDLLGGTGSRLASELGQLHLKHRDAHGGGQMKERPTGGGMDEADEVAPGKAVLHHCHWPLTDRRPDAPQERFQADAMLIGRPQLHLGVWERRRHRLQQRPYFFF